MSDAQTVTLEARLPPTDAGKLAETLREQRGGALSLDASAVEQISTPCVQVLLSAALSWAKDEAELSIVNPSEAFESALSLLGVSNEFTFQ